jgi:hypothetical protein
MHWGVFAISAAHPLLYQNQPFKNIFDLYFSREKVASSVPEMRLARKKNLGPVKY